jgi:uncharacterized protein (DUF3084 family)
VFGFYIIAAVAIIGGFIAYLGDRVGMRVGKKRMTVFGLRPKYTSIIVAIVTGILIAASTLVLLAIVSKDVRTALFHLHQIQVDLAVKQGKVIELTSQVNQKEKEVQRLIKNYQQNEKELARVSIQRQKMQKELELAITQYQEAQSKLHSKEGELIEKQQEVEAKQQRVATLTDITQQLEAQNAKLQEDKERFLAEIEKISTENKEITALSENGLLIFDVNEVIAAKVVQGGTDAGKVRSELITPLLQQANKIALERGARLEGKKDYALKVPVSQMLQISQKIAKYSGKGVLRIVAETNTFFLQPLKVKFQFYPDGLVFKQGEIVAETAVEPSDSEESIQKQIVNLLMNVSKKAFDHGMVSQGQYVGELTSVQDIPTIIGEIKKRTKTAKIQLVVVYDTWRVEGPVKVRIQLKADE